MSNSISLRRCETCGGELIFNEGSGFWQCRFCGNKFYPKDEKGEALVFAINRAAEFRRRSDFDGAIVEYTAILKTYPDDDEANWGMFIARCGIEYVKDDRTGNMIPTCHRTLKGDVLEDKFYQKAIEKASEQQTEIYQKQARAIDRLQKRIKQQMDDEEEYEVFISFKSKDENGYPTRDSVVARNIHDKLTQMGIKTFFSEVSLADRIGDEYEPIIYKALHSCKYFILVTTSEAHTNAVWVKNEWARFRDRMDEEHLSNCAFAVFEGKDSVPAFLRGMQGFDLSRYPSGGYEIAVADFLTLKLGKKKKDDEAEKLKAQLEEQKRFYEEQQRKQAEEDERRRKREEELLRRIEEINGKNDLSFVPSSSTDRDSVTDQAESERNSPSPRHEESFGKEQKHRTEDAVAEKQRIIEDYKSSVKTERSYLRAIKYSAIVIGIFLLLGIVLMLTEAMAGYIIIGSSAGCGLPFCLGTYYAYRSQRQRNLRVKEVLRQNEINIE